MGDNLYRLCSQWCSKLRQIFDFSSASSHTGLELVFGENTTNWAGDLAAESGFVPGSV
mgnify:CR=1